MTSEKQCTGQRAGNAMCNDTNFSDSQITPNGMIGRTIFQDSGSEDLVKHRNTIWVLQGTTTTLEVLCIISANQHPELAWQEPIVPTGHCHGQTGVRREARRNILWHACRLGHCSCICQICVASFKVAGLTVFPRLSCDTKGIMQGLNLEHTRR